MWMCVGLAAAMEVVMLTCFRESYKPIILKRRAMNKRKETGDESWTTEHEDQSKTATTTLLEGMSRPAKIIYSSSLLQWLSLWGGLVFSFFYVNSTSLPEILEVIYGFGPSGRGLSYLAWSKQSLP